MLNFVDMLTGFNEQLIAASKLGKDIKFSGVNKVLICGMGGSALPGDFIKSLFYPLSFELSVCKDYIIPEFIDDSYLCFCISYSGNTEETISLYNQLIKKTKKVVAITSGGELKKLSKKNNTKVILVPKGLQPRMAIGYQSLPVINVMINSKIINYDLSLEIKKTSLVLNYDFKTHAKKIANKLKNVTPLIYASNSNMIVAQKWKISFNENTKTPSFYNISPEWNHNEINGFNNKFSDFIAVFINDSFEHERIMKRNPINFKLLKNQGVNIVEILLKGKSKLSRLFFGIC